MEKFSAASIVVISARSALAALESARASIPFEPAIGRASPVLVILFRRADAPPLFAFEL